MTARSKAIRTPRGQSMIVLAMLAGLVVVPLLGIASFDISRLCLAKQQLQNVADATALTAVATLASQDNLNPTANHTAAMQAALQVFQQNFILGHSLTSTTLVSSSSSPSPKPGSATIYFQFVDPVSGTVQPISSPTAKLVRVYANYGSLTAFGKYIGVPDFNVTAIAKGSVPQLDVVLCFDVSGSMDDQTPCTFVRRQWDATAQKNDYPITIGSSGNANGLLYNVLQPGPNGSSVNVLPPQILGQTHYEPASGIAFADELNGQPQGTPNGLRSFAGYPDKGKAPGNYPTGFSAYGTNTFTDLVVNLDNNPQFLGCTINGFEFPNVATLVEASRGNLEDQIVFKSSKANLSLPSSIVPRNGYQAAYVAAATSLVQPLGDAKNAATNFIEILNTDTDAHFSFVAFDDQIGAGPNGTQNQYTIDPFLPYGASIPFPLNNVPLSSTAGNTQCQNVQNAINQCVALGPTNIGAAIHQAVQTLKANGRPGSVKAIVLFTDGQPTAGGPLDADGATNARMAAVEAGQAGIPVYTIGLAQNPQIVPGETAILNDTNSDPTTGGIAAIAGHKGTFNLVGKSSMLRATFEQIARQLVSLVAQG
ncbi:MAG TPA: VWA domain-containing protein [Oculatellaceae cyanobacterium]